MAIYFKKTLKSFLPRRTKRTVPPKTAAEHSEPAARSARSAAGPDDVEAPGLEVCHVLKLNSLVGFNLSDLVKQTGQQKGNTQLGSLVKS